MGDSLFLPVMIKRLKFGTKQLGNVYIHFMNMEGEHFLINKYLVYQKLNVGKLHCLHCHLVHWKEMIDIWTHDFPAYQVPDLCVQL